MLLASVRAYLSLPKNTVRMYSNSVIITAGLSVLFNTISLVSCSFPLRDCYVGEAPFCNNSIASDPDCRGIEVTTADGWKRMDCDYAVYNIPTTQRETNKWLVIHAGMCDSYTEDLGDFFSVDMGLNIFGLRPCGGFVNSLCASVHGFDSCVALHSSWLFPALQDVIKPHGLGFNPPALVDIYHTPDTNMLFLHEYGDTNNYKWFPADGCNATSAPIHMCVGGIDPNYGSKFTVIKSLLEGEFSNTPWFPCKLEVIDSTPYAQDQDAAIPCTGILREYNNPAIVGGDLSGAPNWAWEMTPFQTRAIQLATEVEPQSPFVNAFREAINIALCKSFEAGQSECFDNDTS